MNHHGNHISRRLWNDNLDLANASLQSGFVQGIGFGDLPLDDFQKYIAQDAYFLEAFARAYALAIAYCPDRKGLFDFVELLNGIVEELKMHRQYADRWKVDLSSTIPGAATTAYIDFLLDTARSGRVDETCAAMTPCMRLYAYLGQELKKSETGNGNPYSEWVNTYSDPGFEDLAATLENLLDHYAIDEDSVKGIYRRAMELELNFFRAHQPVND
jgi:thiaminase/transcriptional activator TenA